MPTTPLLGITQVSPSQNNKEATINDAIEALESATNAKLVVDFSAETTVLLSDSQMTAAFIYEASGATADSILEIPVSINGNTVSRIIAVRNISGHVLTVQFAGAAGSSVGIPNNETRLLAAMDGSDVIVAAEPQSTVSFVSLNDTPGSLTGQQGRFLGVNQDENALVFIDAAVFPSYVNNAGKYLVVNQNEDGVQWVTLDFATAFTELTDAPGDYSGQGGRYVVVKDAEDGVEFIDLPDLEAVEFVAAQRWRLDITTPGADPQIGFGEIEWLDVDGVLLTGAGTPAASNEVTGNEIAFAFDGNIGPANGWLTEDTYVGPVWVEYDFGTPVTPRTVRLFPINNFPDFSPLGFTIQYWNGASWVDAGARTPAPWDVEASQSFKVNGQPLTSIPEAPNNGTAFVRKGGAWAQPTLDDQADVDTTTTPPTAGQTIVWNDTESRWEPGTPVAGINDLSDVDTDTSAPTAGQLLVWNDQDDKWEPGDQASAVTRSVAVGADASDLQNSQSTQFIRFTSGNAKTLNVRPEADHAIEQDAEFHIHNQGGNNLTVVAGTGVSITPPPEGSLAIPTGGTATLKRVSEDTFFLIGITVGTGAAPVSSFDDLDDTPNAYTGQAGKYLAVKSAEDGVEFIDLPTQSATFKIVAATTGDVDLAAGLADGATIDGVNLSTGDRVLVKDQTDATQNGIYVVQAAGAATRAEDADEQEELVNYACFVSEGATNADKFYQCVTDRPIVVDTTALVWEEVSGTAISNISDLLDVDTATNAPTEGQALVWDDTNDVWVPGSVSGGGGASDLDDLSDVDTTTAPPTNGQALVWNEANSSWEPGTVAGASGGVSTSVGLYELINHDFETGDHTDWVDTQNEWSVRSSSFGSVSGAASGTNYLWCETGGFADFIYQDVLLDNPTQGGEICALPYRWAVPFAADTHVAIMQFLDDSDTVLDETQIEPVVHGPGGAWYFNTLVGVAPPSASKIRVGFQSRNRSGSNASSAIDDVGPLSVISSGGAASGSGGSTGWKLIETVVLAGTEEIIDLPDSADIRFVVSGMSANASTRGRWALRSNGSDVVGFVSQLAFYTPTGSNTNSDEDEVFIGGSDTTNSIDGIIDLHGVNQAAAKPSFRSSTWSGGGVSGRDGMITAQEYDQIRFFPGSGTFDGGTIEVWALEEATASQGGDASSSAPSPLPTTEKIGTTENLESLDAGSYAYYTNGSAKTLTVRTEANHALPINGEWTIRNDGAADLTIAPESGVLIKPPAGGTLVIPENGTALLKRVSADLFHLSGQTTDAA